MQSRIEDLREFIINNFLFGDGTALDYDTPFLKNGIIDSTGILELVQYLEENHNISIEDKELVPENFDSLNNISRYLDKKLACVE